MIAVAQRNGDADREILLNLFRRATRSVPGSGEVWARYLRFLERTAPEPTDIEKPVAGKDSYFVSIFTRKEMNR